MTAEGPEPPGASVETPAPEETGERLAAPADRLATGPDGTDPASHVAEGMGYLDQAIAAFSRGCESGDADLVPLAVELLARTLPLRGRDNDAALVWQRGLEDPEPVVSAAVRTRLRRAFGDDEVPADAGGAPPAWWENFVESAVLYGTLPLLANELFGALDQMYSLAALPLVQGGGRARDLREILLSAVRVPSEYAWGPDLHESFHARLRDAMGADADVLPPNWPDD
ncbi:MAG TPA: hypothetical protein VGD68_10975 [Streptosporangiaceae bacterium]